MADFSKLNGYNVKDATARESIENIEKAIYKKWIFIGDSYAEGYSPDGTYTPFTTTLKTLMNLNSSNCIIGTNGGAGFANTLNSFDMIINSITSDNNVTDILIAGGYNDLGYDRTAIINGMNSVKQSINTKFPNATIYVAFIGGTTNDIHGDIYLKKSYYIEGCNLLGLNYLPNLEYILFTSSNFSSDGIHPNQTGQNYIAYALYEALNKGYTYCKFYDLIIDTSESDYFGSSEIPLHLYSNNGISYLSNYSGIKYLNATNYFSVSNDGAIKLGKISQYGIIGSKYYNNNYYNIGNIIIRGYSDPQGYYNMPAQLYVDEDGLVWIKLQPVINDTHDNYLSYTDIMQIQIPQFTIVYPTDVL